MDQGHVKTSVVIPALNEEDTIARIILECKPYADEIIVVDGHSQDRTREVSAEQGAKVILDNKKGKGEAIRHVIDFVSGDISFLLMRMVRTIRRISRNLWRQSKKARRIMFQPLV